MGGISRCLLTVALVFVASSGAWCAESLKSGSQRENESLDTVLAKEIYSNVEGRSFRGDVSACFRPDIIKRIYAPEMQTAASVEALVAKERLLHGLMKRGYCVSITKRLYTVVKITPTRQMVWAGNTPSDTRNPMNPGKRTMLGVAEIKVVRINRHLHMAVFLPLEDV